jgi:hypothetical protein
LVTKQVLGLLRMFVFEEEMCFRLPELGMVAASSLMLAAAGLPPFQLVGGILCRAGLQGGFAEIYAKLWICLLETCQVNFVKRIL